MLVESKSYVGRFVKTMRVYSYYPDIKRTALLSAVAAVFTITFLVFSYKSQMDISIVTNSNNAVALPQQPHTPPEPLSPEIIREIRTGKEFYPKNGDDKPSVAQMLQRVFDKAIEGDVKGVDEVLEEENVNSSSKPKICVLQSDNRVGDVPSIVMSRTLFYRWSLRHNYHYTFATCHAQRGRAALIGEMCGFDMLRKGGGPRQDGCDYVFYADTDAFIRKGSIGVEDIISAHHPKGSTDVPEWMTVLGLDVMDTVKAGGYRGDMNSGELLFNCKHSESENFLRQWWFGSSYEADQMIFGELADHFPQYKLKELYRMDIFYIGLYGRLTYHYAGVKKGFTSNRILTVREQMAKQNGDRNTTLLTEEMIDQAIDTSGSPVKFECPLQYNSKRQWSEDVLSEDTEEYL